MKNLVKDYSEKIKDKYNKAKSKFDFELGLLKRVKSSFIGSALHITEAGELLVQNNQFVLTVLMPVDPVLQKVYIKRGMKVTIKNFLSDAPKKFILDGKEIKLSDTTANIMLRMIANEMQKREREANPTKLDLFVENMKNKIR